MEGNLANRSRAELETALLEGSRALQATLAAQQRGFDGEQARGPQTLLAGVGQSRALADSLQASSSAQGASMSVPSALQRGSSAFRWLPGTQSSPSVCQGLA